MDIARSSGSLKCCSSNLSSVICAIQCLTQRNTAKTIAPVPAIYMDKTIRIGVILIVPVEHQTIGAIVDDRDRDLHRLLFGDRDFICGIADSDIGRATSLHASKANCGAIGCLLNNLINRPFAARIRRSPIVLPAARIIGFAQIVEVIRILGNIPIFARLIVRQG